MVKYSTETEVWKDVVGFEKYYSVSDSGYVYSKRKKTIMKSGGSSTGYPKIDLYDDDGNRYPVQIHRLVAEHFIPNPHDKPQVNHIDGSRDNNKVTNLEWVTSSENMIHARDIGRLVISAERRAKVSEFFKGENHPRSKLSEEDVRNIWKLKKQGIYTQRKIAEFFKVSESTISMILRKQNWKHLDV